MADRAMGEYGVIIWALHPCPILWLFMHFSQQLQHIGDK